MPKDKRSKNLNSEDEKYIAEDKEARQKQASDIFHKHFDPWLCNTLEDYKLVELLDYCQSDERACPNPIYWEGIFKRFRYEKSYMRGMFPPNPLVLGGWWASNDDEKRLRFLTHIYWSYKHNIFEDTKRHIKRLDDDGWYKRPGTTKTTLDNVKQEYKKWVKSNG